MGEQIAQERPEGIPDGYLFSDGAQVDDRGVLRWSGSPLSRVGSMVLLAMRDLEPSINLARWDFMLGVPLPEVGDLDGSAELECPDRRPGKYRITGANLGVDVELEMGEEQGFFDVELHASFERVDERACRECGCTEDRACVIDHPAEPRGSTPGVLHVGGAVTCAWVEDDLCSACDAMGMV